MPPRRRTRLVNAPARADRDARIFVLMQQGWTYDAIAREEAISRERVRQIVNAALKSRGCEAKGLHQLVQLARLDPALRLAAAKVAEGDLRAIDKLVRVINQMDKYSAAAAAGRRVGEREESEEEIRARIFRTLNGCATEEDMAGDVEDDEEDENWEGGEHPRDRILRILAEVDARRAAAAADAAKEAANAATGAAETPPADDTVSKFFVR